MRRGAAFLILLIVIITKLAVSRASNGVNVNVQNSNTATNDNSSSPPSAPQEVLPIIPPLQPDYNYPEVDIQEILKKKGHLRTELEADMVRQYSLRKKELQEDQESS